MTAKITIFLLGLFLASIYFVATMERKTVGEIEDTPQVRSADFDQPFEENNEIENLYRNLANVPPHHTACFPIKKLLCDTGGCTEAKPVVFNLIGGSRNDATISRCDSSPCDTYAAVIEDSGDFKNIQTIFPRGMLWKMSYESVDKKYVEVITLGISAYITYGYCKYDFEL
jgi:hypothetical protein